MKLKDKVAVVTGGTSGLGFATAQSLSRKALTSLSVVFLASADSSYITGIEMFVDGGATQI